MVPAFLARHPPPPASSVDPVVEKEVELYAYPLQGPPLAPARKIRPAPDLSKDFSNEAVSSALFLALSALACPLFVFAHLLPWRAIFLIGGWVAVCSGHPSVAKSIRGSAAEETVKGEKMQAENMVQKFIADDIVLSASPEKREVEIFELQQRVRATSSLFSALGFASDGPGEPEYEPVMYSPNPFTPLDPGRVSGARLKGTRFFEDVQPPRGWTWCESKWRLDLGSQEWVGERCVSGVEVEVEGERWVWDIEYGPYPGAAGEEQDQTAETYEEWVERGGRLRGMSGGSSKNKGNDGTKGKGKEKAPSWEDGTAVKGRKGEWRRRRWLRLVERRGVEERKIDGK